MTEFALLVSHEAIAFPHGVTASPIAGEFLVRAGKFLFPHSDRSHLWTISWNDLDFDTLFLDAQNAVHVKQTFDGTILADVLRVAVAQCDGLALWYANEYCDLDTVKGLEGVLEAVETSLHDPSGAAECYVKFVRDAHIIGHAQL